MSCEKLQESLNQLKEKLNPNTHEDDLSLVLTVSHYLGEECAKTPHSHTAALMSAGHSDWADDLLNEMRQKGQELVNEYEKKPSPSWFTGVGEKGRGILYVTTSLEFDAMFPGYIGEKGINPYGTWLHCKGYVAGERDEDVQRLIEEAETTILEKTGCTPLEIQELHLKFLNNYREKKDAPFPFELY